MMTPTNVVHSLTLSIILALGNPYGSAAAEAAIGGPRGRQLKPKNIFREQQLLAAAEEAHQPDGLPGSSSAAAFRENLGGNANAPPHLFMFIVDDLGWANVPTSQLRHTPRLFLSGAFLAAAADVYHIYDVHDAHAAYHAE
jgi:hypothetical protein